ncbi:flagellar biosynthesis protein FlhF [Peribacillus cavernae]|uniref:Flagellar biosynthesis protein FlhF n=1 Tax=Peribacillus cavernae TaxID=1674310 RepID=A0A3S0W959_9BACI|nr:flagellar biosynthesis protein FlhF [Peribacillus cavernae]MDQ0217058.1 flagellar biosynthesis protein FlhF [Peribacillus cavernae]RUQ30464.1 flagellar biosynthesis protein FlhF [Peribacillus cavernae]
MKAKKYIASSMAEAMKQIREELGNEAVILSSKPIYSGGIFGLFKKRNIEVVAAIDPQAILNTAAQKQKLKRIPQKKQLTDHRLPQSPEQAMQQPAADVLKELGELKGLLKGLQYQGSDIYAKYPGPLKEIYEWMQKQDIDHQLLIDIMDALLEKWFSHKAEASAQEISGWLEAEFINRLEGASPTIEGFDQKYINIVGPTGVGKTTTLAKMAAESILKRNKKVAFITTDTYRIAAIDQLQTYAKILNVPIEIAYNLEDFKNAAEKFSHYDLVFIDTAGRNFRNQDYVDDLKSIIDFEREIETYLVLSLTAKQKDMEEIFEQFSIIPIKQVIFTKADETSSYGSMLNFIVKHRIGAAYITNGQNVPDDIEKASPQAITKTVFGAQK